MSVEKLQSNVPLVNEAGRMTPQTEQAMAKLIAEVIALRAEVNDHEARLVGGGL